MSKWVDKRSDKHDFPLDAALDHIESFECFCRPTYQSTDPVTFTRRIKHYDRKIDKVRFLEASAFDYCSYCAKQIKPDDRITVPVDESGKRRYYKVHKDCELEFKKQQDKLSIHFIGGDPIYAF